MRRGELVPDEMVLQILRLELDRVVGQAVLLDGYPRTVAQARELDRYLQIHAVVSLDIPHEVYFHSTIPDVHDDDDDAVAYRCRVITI
jgi:adenylate kinase family enzyme